MVRNVLLLQDPSQDVRLLLGVRGSGGSGPYIRC